MASLSGLLHRPLSTVAVVAAAAVSSDLPDRFSHTKSSELNAVLQPAKSECYSESRARNDSCSGLSGLLFLSLNQKSLANDGPAVQNLSYLRMPQSLYSSLSAPIASLPLIQAVYQYAKFVKPLDHDDKMPAAVPSSSSDLSYKWHLPDPRAYWASGNDACSCAKSKTVVVLLGWLGSKQRHLKRYADWYTSRGFHAVTFTLPMSEIVSYQVGGKAEQDLELLANHLAGWVTEEGEKNLVFHSFSNTGWLTYGVILEKFQKKDPTATEKIKGCIVDSAPVAAPDPHVWASGFSAAFLKKQSVATKGMLTSNASRPDMLVIADSAAEPKPAVIEAALLSVLEKFFDVVLNVPSINRRLSNVLDLLSSKQPKCPQLYIYSAADRVIPAKSVESFIETQRRAGHEVRACDFTSSPHVDHFRSQPGLYTSQLTQFLEDCVLTCCKESS